MVNIQPIYGDDWGMVYGIVFTHINIINGDMTGDMRIMTESTSDGYYVELCSIFCHTF